MGQLPIPTLKQFLLKRRVLQLYREFFRTLKEIQCRKNRQEITDWIRNDFKKNKALEDEHAIKMLILHGEQALKELRETIALSK